MDQTFKDGQCDILYNNGSHIMQSYVMDSHDDLGINAPPENRVQLQKVVTCSPVSTAGRTGTTSLTGSNTTRRNSTGLLRTYNFGPIDGVSDYTYAYNPTAISDNIGYQITAVIKADQSGWNPIQPFYRADGDVSLFLFAANSVQYTSMTLDPFFLALYNQTNINPDLQLFYPFNPVSVIGCADQYIIKNPNKNLSTTPSSINDLMIASEQININTVQFVTMQRLIEYVSFTNTYYNVFGSGDNALKQSDRISNFLSPAPPFGQWRQEVQGWFEIGLARLQASVVEYAANSASLGSNAEVSFPDANSNTIDIWKSQCANQKICNSGKYQTFSVFGLMFVVCFGIFVVLVSIRLKGQISYFRRRGDNWRNSKREVAYVADDKFQLQRMALEERGYIGWYRADKELPLYEGGALIPHPELHDTTLPDGSAGKTVIYPMNMIDHNMPNTGSRSSSQTRQPDLTTLAHEQDRASTNSASSNQAALPNSQSPAEPDPHPEVPVQPSSDNEIHPSGRTTPSSRQAESSHIDDQAQAQASQGPLSGPVSDEIVDQMTEGLPRLVANTG
ncbi:MAG: hypothetical protein Q9165_005833 [Trypethelium subeluteriae]